MADVLESEMKYMIVTGIDMMLACVHVPVCV